jgi:serine/threonine protein kinase
MGFDLRTHGFTDSIISENLHDLGDNLPKWEKIPHTIVKNNQTTLVEYLSSPIYDISGLILPLYEWGTKIEEGTYGKIYLCKRKKYSQISSDNKLLFTGEDGTFIDIVIKESHIYLSPAELRMSDDIKKNIIQEETDAHIHEAAVLTLAYMAVKKKLPGTVPQVYEIFCKKNTDNSLKSLCIAMEYIKGDTLLTYLRKVLIRDGNNDTIYIDIIKQLSQIIDILQKVLRMNHRDIKVNNILLRHDSKQVVLIDYGFACIANGVQEPAAEFSKIQAGSFFGSRHACFKKGRDICQFLYSLHCYFPFEKYVSKRLYNLIHKWLLVPFKHGIADLLKGLHDTGEPAEERIKNLEYNEGIYLFLRKAEVDPILCSPESILTDLEEFINSGKK